MALGKLLTKQKCDCSEVVSVHEATFFLSELVKVNNIIIDFGHALASGSFCVCHMLALNWNSSAYTGKLFQEPAQPQNSLSKSPCTGCVLPATEGGFCLSGVVFVRQAE